MKIHVDQHSKPQNNCTYSVLSLHLFFGFTEEAKSIFLKIKKAKGPNGEFSGF
jgi:hypothetical protein